MAQTGAIASRPKRKTQAERSCDTRRKLMEAAVQLLSERGYLEMSTTLVTEMAGLSRGAMLHHFPTKADLVRAVTEYILAEQEKLYRARLESLADARARYLAIIDIAHELYCNPPYLAWLEIWLASRSDDALRREIIDYHQKNRLEGGARLDDLARDAGVTDIARFRLLREMFSATFNGMALDRAVLGVDNTAWLAQARALLASLLPDPA